jgi:hypothetical protein
MADIDVSTLDPDTPLRLKLAASLAFPDGSMTESGLKREIERGRLECERIAGKTYVSLNDIKRMRELCRESRRGPQIPPRAQGQATRLSYPRRIK